MPGSAIRSTHPSRRESTRVVGDGLQGYVHPDDDDGDVLRALVKEGVELAHDTLHRMVQRVACDAEELNAIGDRASQLALRPVTSETSTGAWTGNS